MPTKLILDVDTGTDDAVALMLAALHPDLELVAATTVQGNVPVELCTENTLRVFDAIGVTVPVYEGTPRPILRPDFPVPRASGRESGIHGEYLDLPPARSEKQRERAVDFLIDTGATGTAIPGELARDLGLESIGSVQSNTAGGLVTGQVVRADVELRGGLAVRGLRVVALSGLRDHPLLGMDLLGRMHWQQVDGVLRIDLRSLR